MGAQTERRKLAKLRKWLDQQRQQKEWNSNPKRRTQKGGKKRKKMRLY